MTSKGIVYARVEPGLVQVLPRSDAAARHPAQRTGSASARRRRMTHGHRHRRGRRHDGTPLVELDDVSKYYGNIRALRRTSRWRSTPGRSPASSATTARASPPSSRSSRGCTGTTPAPSHRGRGDPLASPREALDRGIATVYQDLAVVPLMPVWRNFFLGSEPTQGPRAAAPPRRRRDARDDPRGAAAHGHRPARRRPADRHPVRRRAPVRGHRPRRLLRRQGPGPGRADRRARRQAVRRGAQVRRRRPRRRARRGADHPQPAPRLSGRRPVRPAQARRDGRQPHQGRRSRWTS